jgi:hypothetical protein
MVIEASDALALGVSSVAVLIAATSVIVQVLQLEAERKARREADQNHQQIVDNQLGVMRASLDRYAEEDMNRHINYLVPVCFIVIHAIAKSRFYSQLFKFTAPPQGRDALTAIRSNLRVVLSDYRLVDDQLRSLFNDHQYSVATTAMLLSAHKYINDTIIFFEMKREHQDATDIHNEVGAIASRLFLQLDTLRPDIIAMIGSEESYNGLLYDQYERYGLNRRGEWLTESDRMEISSPGATDSRPPMRDWLETGIPERRPVRL